MEQNIVFRYVQEAQVNPASFCYDHPSCAPESWGQYNSVCNSGKFQSPIDLQKAYIKFKKKPVTLELSKEYAYVHSPFLLVNNGHGVRLTLGNDEGSKCLVRGKGFAQKNERYFFHSLHFHWGPDESGGAEHTIDGRHFPLELHMVHLATNDKSKVSVFGVMYQISQQDNPALNAIVDNLHLVRRFNSSSWVHYTVNLTDLIPPKVKFFRYEGSWTIPDCTEGVMWTVFDDIQNVSARQVRAFRSLLQQNGRTLLKNYRPIQPTFTSLRRNIYYMRSKASVKNYIAYKKSS